MGDDDRFVLRAGDDALTIDPAAGARFASIVIGEDELTVTDGDGPIWWGCYPMVPFAGRIRDGVLRFRGRTHRLTRNLGPNAIHGTVFDRAWTVVSADSARAILTTDLGPGWPFAGNVTQTLALGHGTLDASLTLEAEEPMPAWMGWHPWFRRRVGGAEMALDFDAAGMFVRDADGLPTGEVRPPTAGPWDDAFTGVASPPRLTWPGVLTLEIASPAGFWVVFNERDDALCVEPQTAPPDAINLAEASGSEPPHAEPGRPLSTSMTWRWTRA